MKNIINIFILAFIVLANTIEAFPISVDNFEKNDKIKISEIFDFSEINLNGQIVLFGIDPETNTRIIIEVDRFKVEDNTGCLRACVVNGSNVYKSIMFSSEVNDNETPDGVIAQFSFENTKIKLVVSISKEPSYRFGYWAIKE